MSTDTAPAPVPRKVVLTTPVLDRGANTSNVVVALVAAVVSVVAHAVLILLMMSISVGNVTAGAGAEDVENETKVEEPQKEEADLTNPDIGLDANAPTAYLNVPIADISVPGPADPTAAPGIVNAPRKPPMKLLPPPAAAGRHRGGSAAGGRGHRHDVRHRRRHGRCRERRRLCRPQRLPRACATSVAGRRR